MNWNKIETLGLKAGARSLNSYYYMPIRLKNSKISWEKIDLNEK